MSEFSETMRVFAEELRDRVSEACEVTLIHIDGSYEGIEVECDGEVFTVYDSEPGDSYMVLNEAEPESVWYYSKEEVLDDFQAL